ncbi:MAG: metallophosphoesterase, partial [Lachnospiraceae bacterium]|nr:metallophosphoesterase [Lachnospiraceae bacterium]
MSGDFKTVHYTIHTDKPGTSFRIVHLSDLHLSEHGPGNSCLIGACESEKPDIILLTGDMVNSKAETESELAPAIELVRGLSGTAPVYAVNGNHESKLRRRDPDLYKVYTAAVKAAGAVILNNKSARATVRGRNLRITGVELPYTAYKKMQKIHFSREDLAARVGDVPSDGAEAPYQILLAHSPAFAESYA